MTDQTENSALQQAVELLRVKNYAAALEILTPYLQQNPRSENGWFLMSFAVSDPELKIECLQQVLQINPNNLRASERLQKLEVRNQPEVQFMQPMAEKAQKKPTRRWLRYSMAIFALIIIVGLGYFSVQFLIRLLNPAQTPAIAQLAPSETAAKPPTQVPTETATPTPTAEPTQTPIPTEIPATATPITPTPSRDLDIPTGDLAQEMDHVQNQVATLRELGIQVDYPRFIIPQNKVRSLLTELFLERNTKDAVKDQARVLEVLGLIEPTYDLYGKTVSSLGEGLGGFFIPWTDEIFVIGEEFGPVEKLVYAHEYMHALSDQHFEIDEIGVYPECLQETDRCNAISAFLEGEATYLMYRWQESYASEADIAAIVEAQFSPIDEILSSEDFPPPYTIRETYFKYFDGQNFVKYIFDGEENETWEDINDIYANLPVSSEQILHPEKYIMGETPTKVALQPIDAILGDDWRLITTDTLGELTTEMILGHSYNYLTHLDPITASQAAAGWGGDQYQVYYRGRTNHTLLVVQWDWDTIEDALEFKDALSEHLNRRFRGVAVPDRDNCWMKVNDHATCYFTNRNQTLWVIAPDLNMIDKIAEKYLGFR